MESIDEKTATECLVLMVVCLNSSWKLAIANFMIAG